MAKLHQSFYALFTASIAEEFLRPAKFIFTSESFDKHNQLLKPFFMAPSKTQLHFFYKRQISKGFTKLISLTFEIESIQLFSHEIQPTMAVVVAR